MKEYIEIIECRDCESKNCYGCNILTLADMLNSGAFDGMMDEHHYIIPAADVVERKRGEWVMKETMIRSLYAKNAYCSECLEETGFCHNFCPNCGAYMRGEKHEAD